MPLSVHTSNDQKMNDLLPKGKLLFLHLCHPARFPHASDTIMILVCAAPVPILHWSQVVPNQAPVVKVGDRDVVDNWDVGTTNAMC